MDVTYEVHARRADPAGERLAVVPVGAERDARALADRLRAEPDVVDVEVRRVQASARTRGARWESVRVDDPPPVDRDRALAGVAAARAAIRRGRAA